MIKLPENARLTPGEKLTPLWLKLEAYLSNRLQALRERNDSPKSEHETATLRGQIGEVKALLALGKDAPIIE